MKEQKFIRCGAHLPVKNLSATLDYYKHKLGFYDEWTYGEKDGGIGRDEMRLLFAEDATFTEIINTYEKSRFSLLWFVNNIEAIFSELKAKTLK